MATKLRIGWIDGLKGVCGVLVAFIHYLLAFKPDGFVGWNSIPSEAEKFDYYFEHFPYSILTNGSFILYTDKVIGVVTNFIISKIFKKTKAVSEIPQ